MTDRELLEAAAKAAGYVVFGYADDMVAQPGQKAGGLVIRNERGGDFLWHPGADDGDALRLAVKLNLAFVFHPVLNQALCRPYHTRDMDAESREDGEKYADPYAATRRAIVRAAAEIGRG